MSLTLGLGMSVSSRKNNKESVNILLPNLMSEKNGIITFSNIFLIHQYSTHIFYLRYPDIKNIKVKCSIERGV